RFTLNLTRANMIQAGYSPSVRLFEAAACGVPIISDCWMGLDEFFDPGSEIFVARSTKDVLEILHDIPERERRAVGERARRRIMAEHTSFRRSIELEDFAAEAKSAVLSIKPN